MRATKSTVLRRITAGVIAAAALTACGGDPGNPDAGGDILDGTTNSQTTKPAGATFPLSAEYAGLTWTMTGAKVGKGDCCDTAVLADFRVTNNNPFVMYFDVRALALETADGIAIEPDAIVGTGNWQVKVGDGKTTKVTVEFGVESAPAIDGLTLVIAEEDRIPERVPLAGGAEAKPYPVEVGFTGKTKPMAIKENEQNKVVTFTAVKATVGLDHLGVRASTASRLVRFDLRLDAPAKNTAGVCFGRYQYRLDADGELLEPARFFEQSGRPSTMCASIAPDTTQPVSAVFDFPADAENLTLVLNREDGSDSARIPVKVDELPPCCGE